MSHGNPVSMHKCSTKWPHASGTWQMLGISRPVTVHVSAQDAWGRTALHWAAAYACEASVVLLLVRGAHAAPLSHGTEAQPPLAPGDMAAAAGHVGLAAFLAEHALVQLMKDHNVTLDDPMEASELLLPPASICVGLAYGARI